MLTKNPLKCSYKENDQLLNSLSLFNFLCYIQMIPKQAIEKPLPGDDGDVRLIRQNKYGYIINGIFQLKKDTDQEHQRL